MIKFIKTVIRTAAKLRHASFFQRITFTGKFITVLKVVRTCQIRITHC